MGVQVEHHLRAHQPPHHPGVHPLQPLDGRLVLEAVQVLVQQREVGSFSTPGNVVIKESSSRSSKWKRRSLPISSPITSSNPTRPRE